MCDMVTPTAKEKILKIIDETIDKVILWSLSNLNKWHLARIEKEKMIIDNPDNYEALLPHTQTDEERYYSSALTVALKTPNVNNIAITGAYGSGKSSFLRTFERENAEWNYLPISLATFKEKKEEEKKGDSNSDNKVEITVNPTKPLENIEKTKFELHQDIERSILQQFFYREKASKVPHSRFKRIANISKKITFFHTILISFLLFYFFSNISEKFAKIFSFNLLESDKYSLLPYIIGLIIFYYMYKIIYALWNMKISQFNYKKGTITLAKQDKASILNEHIEEILYFFEATDYDIVVFEDLDRFDDTEIFIKLRELNNLINNSKQIGRRIIFIYAIKDDMFLDKERTKFFDFILPIIPYINPSNSERKLIDKFEKEIESKKIDTHFISKISLYIDDMRLLLNIYNEYTVYRKNLNSASLDHNKILALIICKNFYPLDFAKLHTRDGIIYQLFSDKPLYIKEKIRHYNVDKIDIENKIKNIQNENIQNLDELKMIYLGRLFSEINADAMTINNYREKILSDLVSTSILEELENDTVCQGLVKAKSPYQNQPLQLNNSKKITFGEIETLINPKFTYLERKELIENKSNNKIDELKKDIEEINQKINILKKATLKELFETSSDIIISDEYKDKKLLIFLVRHGHIDEYYEHYISYFHEGGITQDDREFLLSVQNYNALKFTFRLTNIVELIEKLEDIAFEKDYVLNFDLLRFLLQNKDNYKEKLEKFLEQLSNESKLSIQFIFDFIDITEEEYKIKFIQELQWSNLWRYIHNNFSLNKQDEYFELIFKALSVEEMIELNIDNTLKDYIEAQTILPIFSGDEHRKFIELINSLDIKFKKIDNPEYIRHLLPDIYFNKNYVISKEMIDTIINNIDINIHQIKLNESHLTTIYKSSGNNKKLIEYIDESINEYIENVFLTIETNTKESEDTVISLLNNENISLRNKIRIIQKEEVRISNINDLENKELWIELIKANKIEATWDNLLYAYQELNELDNTTVAFLNREENYIELSNFKINNEELFDKETILSEFNEKVILSENISEDAYKYLIKSIRFWKYPSLAFEKLSTSKIDCILEETKLALSQDNLDKLKEHFSPKHIMLIENFKDEFLEKFDEFELDSSDILNLLNSSKFSIDEKFTIIERIDLSLFEDNTRLIEKVSKLYIDENREIKEIKLFEKLFYAKPSLELFVSQISYWEDCESCEIYLAEFDTPYSELLEKSRSKLYLDDTKINRLLLSILKKKNSISSYKIHTTILGKNELKVERKRV